MGECPRKGFRSRRGCRTAARKLWGMGGGLFWVFRCARCDRWHMSLREDDPDIGGRAYATFSGRRRG